MKHIFVTIFIVYLTTNCSTKDNEKDQEQGGYVLMNEYSEEEKVSWTLYDMSIIKLLSNPEAYDGKIVGIRGYLNLEFEGDAVYLSKEDYENSIFTNGFWVNFSENIEKSELESYSGKYVWLTGRVDTKNRGHLGLWSGELNNIFEIRTIGNNK